MAMIGNWFGVSKCDPRVVTLYSRHYSSKKSKKTPRDWRAHGIVPNGESITLITFDGSALFVWLKQQMRDDGQEGVNCAVFRNEGALLSSDLILEAEQFAWERWQGERLFTFVDAEETKKRRGKKNPPGYCFIQAGWKQCGISKRGLIVLEKMPMAQELGVWK